MALAAVRANKSRAISVILSLNHSKCLVVSHLNNYLTRVRLSVCLWPWSRHCATCDYVRPKPWRVAGWNLHSRNKLRHLHVEKRGRWGAWWARGTRWKSANLRHRVYVLKSRREIGEKCEKAFSTGRLPGRYLGYQGSHWHGINTDV